MSTLSHLDETQRPRMVDVGGKPVTARLARARARVALTPALEALLADGEIRSPKGPVFQTAILAGIQGAKRCADLIPLCHPLPLDSVAVTVEAADAVAEILCTVRCTGRTGVEMEALTGASVAALTLIDMGKALGPGLKILEVELLEKTGGQHGDWHA